MSKKNSTWKDEKRTESTHGNSKFSRGKWKWILRLIEKDVSVENACSKYNISKSTFYDWMKTDSNLSDEYHAAKVFLDIAASNNIYKAIVEEESVKDSREYIKRRRKRYIDETSEDSHNPPIIITKVYDK